MSNRITVTVSPKEASNRTSYVEISKRVNKCLNFTNLEFPTKRLERILKSVSTTIRRC
ncbi:hypothetical protein IC582_011885 [Cucumis melo]